MDILGLLVAMELLWAIGTAIVLTNRPDWQITKAVAVVPAWAAGLMILITTVWLLDTSATTPGWTIVPFTIFVVVNLVLCVVLLRTSVVMRQGANA